MEPVEILNRTGKKLVRLILQLTSSIKTIVGLASLAITHEQIEGIQMIIFTHSIVKQIKLSICSLKNMNFYSFLSNDSYFLAKFYLNGR